VTYLGALEGKDVPTLPTDLQTECYYCYWLRKARHQEVELHECKELFLDFRGTKRGHRVREWNQFKWYTALADTSSSGAASSADSSAVGQISSDRRREIWIDKWRQQKRSYDEMHNDLTYFDNTPSCSALNLEEHAITYKSTDQYTGHNAVQYEGRACILVNWATKTKKKNHNAQLASLIETATKRVLLKGRCLEGQCGAHNLCVVSNVDPERHALLKAEFAHWREIIAFGIGGEYRHPQDPRGESGFFTGISLFGLAKTIYKGQEGLEWLHKKILIKGDHPGQTEGRSKCGTKFGLPHGISEFDGQSAMTWYKNEFWVYTRANPKERGYRSVQVCHGSLSNFGDFEMCRFEDMPDAADVYFLHPYVIPGGKCIFSLLSYVDAPGGLQRAGVYCAVSDNGVNFRKPILVHECDDYERRAIDLPVQGDVEFTETGISFYVHRNVPCRMSPKDHRKEAIVHVQVPIPKYVRQLWSKR